MAQFKIKLNNNPGTCEILMDGKPVFAHELSIHVTPAEVKAVITVYDVELEYEGDAEVKKLTRDSNGNWNTREELEKLAQKLRGQCTCVNGCKNPDCDKL